MRKILLSLAAGLALSAATVVTATANPSPTGSPGQPGATTTGGTTCQGVGSPVISAGAAGSQSPFNFSTTTTSSAHYASTTQGKNQAVNAQSQYDIACFQASVH